jgi:hypothetical protein
MSPQTDISAWLNFDQVAARTGIARRTLEREVAAGKWQTRKRPNPPKKAETVFNPEEVAARIPPPVQSVVRHSAMESDNTAALAEMDQAPVTLAGIAEVVAMVCERIIGAPQPVPEPKPLFVDLDEAKTITGLSEGCLWKLIADEKISCIRYREDNRRVTKVRRAELEAFGGFDR